MKLLQLLSSEVLHCFKVGFLCVIQKTIVLISKKLIDVDKPMFKVQIVNKAIKVTHKI